MELLRARGAHTEAELTAAMAEALLRAGADVNLQQTNNGVWGAQRELGVRGVGTAGPRCVRGQHAQVRRGRSKSYTSAGGARTGGGD